TDLNKKNIKLAIAESHPLLRQTLVRMFTFCNDIAVVVQVANGYELIEELKKKQVNVILLDWRMPVLDGSDTLQVIRYRFPAVSVVMYSSNNEVTLRSTLLKN